MNPIITLSAEGRKVLVLWQNIILIEEVSSGSHAYRSYIKYGAQSDYVDQTVDEIEALIFQATQPTAPAEPEVELRPMSELTVVNQHVSAALIYTP